MPIQACSFAGAMQVFLFEYLTSGAFPGSTQIKASLAPEGAAMLRAIATDAAAVPGWQVSVTWDAELGSFGVAGIDVHPVRSSGEERHVFERLAATSDASFVIAPEFGGILEARARLVGACGGRLVGPTPGATALCADKLALARRLREYGVPTIETRLCDFGMVAEIIGDGGAEFVIKPRYGAGSLDTFHVRNRVDLAEAEVAYRSADAIGEPIVQPYVAGLPLSIAAIVGSSGAELFPLCWQHIDGRQRLHYAGGFVPARTSRDGELVELARRTVATIPGLSGYVGIDLLLPDVGEPLVAEINPRLTSSYHGYRRLALSNVAERILAPEHVHAPLQWRSGRVEFTPDGTARDVALAEA